MPTPDAPTAPERTLAGRRDPAARRAAIVRAAATVAATVGPANLTHRAVAREAGVALGSTTQYFASIDELRETALEHLADEFERDLHDARASLDRFPDDPGPFAAHMHRFLSSPSQVQADIALISSACTEPRLRALARRWYDGIVGMLTERVGALRAETIAFYLDGAITHAAIQDEPVTRERLSRTLRALATMPTPEGREDRP